MKNHLIKVGVCVPSMKVADPAYNTKEIIHLMQENADCGLLVFPELAVTGYTCADLFGQSALLDRAEDGINEIAQASTSLKGLTVAAGVPVRFENGLYNCVCFISEGYICGLVPKINLPTYSEFYESRWFLSGKSIHDKVISFANQAVPFGRDLLPSDAESGVIIGVDICEDLWVPDKPSTHAALAGANILINPSASDEVIGKQDYRRSIVMQQSADTYSAYLYVSSGMDESSTDLVFSGHCMIAENGKLLKDSIYPERSHVETALIDLEALEYNRRHQNTFPCEGNENYRMVPVNVKAALDKRELTVTGMKNLLKKEGKVPSRMPFVPSDDQELKKRCETILAIQANGLATRVRATGIKNLVIGVSGGLDSTLALIVCHEAQKIVPDIHIIAYTMPSKGNTTSLTYENAMELMKALEAEIHEVEIGSQVKEHLLSIGHSEEYQGDGDTTYENAQARMRTYILMDVANNRNGLVVGTGDLSELALGWCTYNGDHMSMYGVNASVPKTLVQYIVRGYALTCGDERLKKVLLSIVDTPISPELTPNKNGKIAQKTEEKIGKYDLNDFFLFYSLRYGFAPDKVLAMALSAYQELDKETVKNAAIRFYNRFFHQQFKRSCLPDGPKVGSITLSPRGDWRMPSDASGNLWIEILKKA